MRPRALDLFCGIQMLRPVPPHLSTSRAIRNDETSGEKQ